MAYQQEDQDDELNPEATAGTGPEGGGATLGAGAEGGAGGNAPAATEPAAPAGSGGPKGQFVGINKYLDANKAQSQKLAGNVGGYVEGLSQAVRDTLPGQQEAFNKAADQGAVGINQDLFNEAKQNVAGVASDAQKKAEFQRMRDAQYKGPQDLQSSEYFKPIQDSLKKAQQAGEQTTTEQGQRQLLGDFSQAKTGQTTGQGVRTFDQMLLQGGGGKERLAQAREKQKDLPGLIESANQASLAKAKEASDRTAQTRQAIQDEFLRGSSSQTPIELQLKQRAQDQINQSNSQSDRLANTLKGGLRGLTAQDRQLLGLSDGSYGSLRDIENFIQGHAGAAQGGGFDFSGEGTVAPQDMSKFLLRQNPNISAQNVATADEYARYAALNDLMGLNNSFLSNPSMAGTANTDAADFDLGGARQYLENIAKNYSDFTPYVGGPEDEGDDSTWNQYNPL